VSVSDGESLHNGLEKERKRSSMANVLAMTLVAVLILGTISGLMAQTSDSRELHSSEIPARTPARILHVMHSPISIIGNAGFTAANGVVGGSGTASDPYVIESWEIESGVYACISISSVGEHVIIRDVYVHSAMVGIGIWNCSNVSIVDSTISNNTLGAVDITNSHYITVTNCSISSSVASRDHGLMIDTSSSVNITGNRFFGKGISFATPEGLYGDTPNEFYCSHDIAPDNLLNGKPVVYRHDEPNVALSGAFAGQVVIANCSSARLNGLDIIGGDEAIFVVNSPDATISNCTLSNNFVAIHAHNSQSCSVSHNVISGGLGTGIWLSKGCNNSLVTDNMVTGDGNYSIRVEMCSTTILGNTASDGGGIHVGYYVVPVVVRNNTVTNCSFGVFGMNMYEGGLTIDGNEISDCWWGIRASLCIGANVTDNVLVRNEYGVHLESSINSNVTGNHVSDGHYGIYLLECHGVTVHDNFLINNTVATRDVRGDHNHWDSHGIPSIYICAALGAALAASAVAVIMYRRKVRVQKTP
jgi:parallel beta-helix repeat protein